MSILQLVADCNTKALDFLALSQHQDARRVWNEALRLTRGFLQDNRDGRGAQTVTSISASSGFLIESTLAIPESMVERLAANNGAGFFALFLKNFSFQSGSSLGCSTQDGGATLVDQATAVLLFNIALSHHCEAIQTQCSNEIATAMRLYQLAMTLLSKSLAQEDTMGALMLAILNNMGHIFETFLVDRMCAVQCLESMEDIFFALPPNGALGVDEAFFHRYETIFLFRKWRVAAAA